MKGLKALLLLSAWTIAPNSQASTGPHMFVSVPIFAVLTPTLYLQLHLTQVQFDRIALLQTQTLLQLANIRDKDDIPAATKRDRLWKERLRFEAGIDRVLSGEQRKLLDRHGGTNRLLGRRTADFFLELPFLDSTQNAAMQSVIGKTLVKVDALRSNSTMPIQAKDRQILTLMDQCDRQVSSMLTPAQRELIAQRQTRAATQIHTTAAAN